MNRNQVLQQNSLYKKSKYAGSTKFDSRTLKKICPKIFWNLKIIMRFLSKKNNLDSAWVKKIVVSWVVLSLGLLVL